MFPYLLLYLASYPMHGIGAEFRAVSCIILFGGSQSAEKADLYQILNVKVIPVIANISSSDFTDKPLIFYAQILFSLPVTGLYQQAQFFIRPIHTITESFRVQYQGAVPTFSIYSIINRQKAQ